MKELLKPLTAADGFAGSEGDTGSNGAMDDYACEALGRALSDQGGFGIASRVIAQVSQSGNQPATAPVTTSLSINNGPSRHK